jgi:Tol biopolymer transport system component
VSRPAWLVAAASIAALALGASAASPATSGRIAYVGKWRHLPALYVANGDGSGRKLIAGRVLDHTTFSWSPDGRRIAFPLGKWGKLYFEGDGRIDLYTIRPDGTGRHRFAQIRNERDHCACAGWSPDGTKIAYEAPGGNGKPDIFVMNANGTGRKQLTSHPARDENPDWSPDGTQIAFYSERTGNGQIYVMNADGTNQHRITHDPWYDQAVRWQPTR